MNYKVLIPTAGTGSRLGGMTKYINKSLIGVGNKPALSRIIESFPEETEFVIATGYKGELVKEYLSLAYPGRKIQFVDILLYEGEGSGIGLTILRIICRGRSFSARAIRLSQKPYRNRIITGWDMITETR